MALYAFDDFTLEVNEEGEKIGEDLAQLFEELSWIRMPHLVAEPSLRLSVRIHSNGLRARRRRGPAKCSGPMVSLHL